MEKRRKIKKPAGGSILPLAVIMVVILAVLGFGILNLGLNARILAIRNTEKISARQAADAGLAQARKLMDAKLINEVTWDNSTLPAQTTAVTLSNTYGNANYVFDVNGDPCNGFIINSTGTAGMAQKTVHCKLIVKSSWFGLGVKEGITMNQSTTMGTYPAGGSLVIRTNSTKDGDIIVRNGVIVPGDVVVGPGGDPAEVITVMNNAAILGNTYAAEAPINFPPVDVPSYLTSLAPTTYSPVPGGLTGNIRYDGLSFTGVQTVVGHCEIYVNGPMTMGNGAELKIMPGGSLALYLNGNLVAQNSVGITNETADATKLYVYGTDNCTQLDLKAKSTFYGAVYAPNAQLDIFNNGDMYGAFIGNRNLSIKNSGCFYFDTRLLGALVNDTVAYLGVQRWWED